MYPKKRTPTITQTAIRIQDKIRTPSSTGTPPSAWRVAQFHPQGTVLCPHHVLVNGSGKKTLFEGI